MSLGWEDGRERLCCLYREQEGEGESTREGIGRRLIPLQGLMASVTEEFMGEEEETVGFEAPSIDEANGRTRGLRTSRRLALVRCSCAAGSARGRGDSASGAGLLGRAQGTAWLLGLARRRDGWRGSRGLARVHARRAGRVRRRAAARPRAGVTRRLREREKQGRETGERRERE
jgi:hypothetical protein